jgi:hypothetical protein
VKRGSSAFGASETRAQQLFAKVDVSLYGQDPRRQERELLSFQDLPLNLANCWPARGGTAGDMVFINNPASPRGRNGVSGKRVGFLRRWGDNVAIGVTAVTHHLRRCCRKAFMLLCFALLGVAAAPAQDGQPALSNIRATYGVQGPERPDRRVLPGDNFILSFEIDGAEVAADGKVHYTIAMEVTDQLGDVRFKQVPRPNAMTRPPGRRSLPAMANLHVGLDEPPGEYTLRVSVTDRTARTTREIAENYEVLPKAFGLVQVVTIGDPDAEGPSFFQAGKAGLINFLAVGFGRNESQSNFRVVMNVTDADGRPALAKPVEGEVKEKLSSKTMHIPMQFQLELKRAGQFTVELKAQDRVTGQNSLISFPLTVAAAK